jgi:hypothetical protein
LLLVRKRLIELCSSVSTHIHAKNYMSRVSHAQLTSLLDVFKVSIYICFNYDYMYVFAYAFINKLH